MLAELLFAASLHGAIALPPVPTDLGIIEVANRLQSARRSHGGLTDIIPCCVVPPPNNPGASLPITVDLATLPGTKRYLDPAGSDAAACTVGAPCLTLGRAQSVASSGDSIVVHGGTYLTEGSTYNGSSTTAETTISKPLTIVAYTGETPVFDGAANITSGPWTTEGSYKYATYIPRACTDGSGINFCSTGDNVTGGAGGVGMFPDQVWIDGVRIQQVATKAAVATGKFFVDTVNNRVYMLTTQVNAATTISISNLGDWLSCSAANVTFKGLTVKRYSNTASRVSVLDLNATCDTVTLNNDLFQDAAMSTISLVGNSGDLITGATFQNITIDAANWMGIASTYAKDVVFDAIKITNGDPLNEFTDSPQSGGIKTGRNYNFTLSNSQLTDNREPGIWMDQSNYHAIIYHNTIKNNGGLGGTGACVYFEISDMLWLIDNDINCNVKAAVKLAGSSGLNLVNNTIVGGTDAVGFYADARSNLTNHCADPAFLKCGTFPNSDRWAASSPALPATMDWMPRMDLMINNIIIDPDGTGLCSTTTAFCILSRNVSATPGSESTIDTMIHVAEPGRGIPQTQIDCNVYGNGTARIINRQHTTNVSYTAAQFGTWKSYTAGAPISIAGIDANSLADPTGRTYTNVDGTPTAALTALHSSACAVPTDATINGTGLAAGTKHFGYTGH